MQKYYRKCSWFPSVLLNKNILLTFVNNHSALTIVNNKMFFLFWRLPQPSASGWNTKLHKYIHRLILYMYSKVTFLKLFLESSTLGADPHPTPSLAKIDENFQEFYFSGSIHLKYIVSTTIFGCESSHISGNVRTLVS